MSILSWLSETLGKFIDGFGSFINKLIHKVPAEIRENVSLVIRVVNGVKSAVDSPIADVLTSLIPGGIDDAVKTFLRDRLPDVLEKLKVIEDGIIKLSDDSVVRAAQLRAVSSVLTQELTGMDPDQAAITTQVVYKAEK